MWGSIKYNLSHLFDGSGRDARQTFWFYVLFLFIMQIAVSFLVMIPVMASVMSEAFSSAQRGADQAAMQAQMMSPMGEFMEVMVWAGLATSIATVVLLGASVIRRLHDSGKSGFWAAIMGVLYLGSTIYSFVALPEMMKTMAQVTQSTSPEAMMEAQAAFSSVSFTVASLLGWIPMIMFVVFGVMQSDPEPNKYGEEPVRF